MLLTRLQCYDNVLNYQLEHHFVEVTKMKRIVRVSRQGLTECPGCHAHVKTEEELTLTHCPFCETSLLARDQAQGVMGVARKFAGSKTGLLAATLFGASLVACSPGPGNNDGNVSKEATPDAGVAPMYGLPAEPATEQAPDGGNNAMYGLPAEPVRETMPGEPNQAAYGLPPDQNP